MYTSKLKVFAQQARIQLLEQVDSRLSQVLLSDNIARRENPKAVKELEDDIEQQGKQTVIDKVAYTWFNRFCALRFMDINGYNRIRVVSPLPNQTQPEILAEAKMGVIDDDFPESQRQQILDLLNGNAKSNDPQAEAYRLLLVASCNALNKAMPFLFQKIDDYTELLMPSDLLSANSVLGQTIQTIDEDEHKDVEVIGWLYQFYISEKKEKVFADLKKNKKITPANIPAATQLFTPNWIVRYLVQNSLGRLWLLNKPNSNLADQMEYYIPDAPDSPTTDFLKIENPQDLKICDPACGSGHMLIYAFDLLYCIYEEQGYQANEIPELILKNNLFGIEIDERAGELAAFALIMKARSKYRRFLNKGIKPNICVLENVQFDDDGLDEYINIVGQDLFNKDLRETLKQFDEVDNFGSLIIPKVQNVADLLVAIEKPEIAENLLLEHTNKKVHKVLEMVDYLSQKYHVVVANPPYMGGKGMNPRLGAWAKNNYPDSKSDLFAMFMESGFDLVINYGYSAMVTMQSWMFLSSYEKLRKNILNNSAIECMAHMANMVMGIAFGTAATVIKKGGSPKTKGAYCYVEYEDIGEGNKPTQFPPRNERNLKAANTK